MNSNPTRLREHPNARFAAAEHVLNLAESVAQLRAEEHSAQCGHRQITLYHHAPLTMVLFAFEPEGELRDHATAGLVTIQALDGALTVQTPEQTYQLTAGMIVVLAPKVRHSVRAAQASSMLLTVHLQVESPDK